MVVDAVLGPIQLQDVRFPFGQLASWMAFIARISDDVAEWAVDVKERALAGLLSHVENEVAGRAKGNAEQDGEVDEAENDDGDVESDASESSDETSGDDSDSSDDLDSSDDTVSTTSAASSASVASSSTSSANSSDSDSHSDSENEATSSTPNYTPRSRFADHLLSILLQHIDTTRRSTATARTTKRLHDLAEQFSIKFPQHRSAVAAAFRNGR